MAAGIESARLLDQHARWLDGCKRRGHVLVRFAEFWPRVWRALAFFDDELDGCPENSCKRRGHVLVRFAEWPRVWRALAFFDDKLDGCSAEGCKRRRHVFVRFAVWPRVFRALAFHLYLHDTMLKMCTGRETR
jgi:hypothetical protein